MLCQAVMRFDGRFKENSKSRTRRIHLQSCPKACQSEGLEGWQTPQLPEVRALPPEPEGLCPQRCTAVAQRRTVLEIMQHQGPSETIDGHSYLTPHAWKRWISVWSYKDTWNRYTSSVLKARCELAGDPNSLAEHSCEENPKDLTLFTLFVTKPEEVWWWQKQPLPNLLELSEQPFQMRVI